MSDNRHDSSDERDSLINDLRISLNKSIKETTTIIENLKANIDSSIEDEENRKTIKENASRCSCGDAYQTQPRRSGRDIGQAEP